MFGKKNPEDKLSRYEDPTGGISSKDLRLAEWYVGHKLFFERIALGVLSAFAIITLSYGLIGWGKYFAFDYFDDQNMYVNQVVEIENYEKLHVLYGAKDLQVFNTKIFRPATDKYDFATEIANPNDSWIARVNYKYAYSGGETKIFQSLLLPNTRRSVVGFGHDSISYPSNAKFEIENIKWEKIDPHEKAFVDDFVTERVQFNFDNFKFSRSSVLSDTPSHRIEFDLSNDSAYSYWEPEFLVELLGNGQVVGIMYFTIEEFIAGEVRHIDLRSVAEQLEVFDIRVHPINNVFDDSVFMKPGE
jgi:hypothetical protein